MTNPFEDEDGEYLVLVNDEDQHSLWPSFREIPAGWTAVGPKGKRQECPDWITANWTDMRPRSLRSRDGQAPRVVAGSKCRFGSRAMYQGANLIFLVSQPRVGSTMLQRILGGHSRNLHTIIRAVA